MRLRQQLGITALIVVTHDAEEAVALADRLITLRDGLLVESEHCVGLSPSHVDEGRRENDFTRKPPCSQAPCPMKL